MQQESLRLCVCFSSIYLVKWAIKVKCPSVPLSQNGSVSQATEHQASKNIHTCFATFCCSNAYIHSTTSPVWGMGKWERKESPKWCSLGLHYLSLCKTSASAYTVDRKGIQQVQTKWPFVCVAIVVDIIITAAFPSAVWRSAAQNEIIKWWVVPKK